MPQASPPLRLTGAPPCEDSITLNRSFSSASESPFIDIEKFALKRPAGIDTNTSEAEA